MYSQKRLSQASLFHIISYIHYRDYITFKKTKAFVRVSLKRTVDGFSRILCTFLSVLPTLGRKSLLMSHTITTF
jgi:hypothetical protein